MAAASRTVFAGEVGSKSSAAAGGATVGFEDDFSPEQDLETGALVEIPRRSRCVCSDETIYKALYVQGRATLFGIGYRTWSTQRSAPKHVRGFAAIPGDWEGDLILGSTASAFGDTAPSSNGATGVVMLAAPARDHTAETVRSAVDRQDRRTTEQLQRSRLGIKRGSRMMAKHELVTAATGSTSTSAHHAHRGSVQQRRHHGPSPPVFSQRGTDLLHSGARANLEPRRRRSQTAGPASASMADTSRGARPTRYSEQAA
ncbi:hypothetical protein FQA39_LY19134 [Lamprigera yunnana]|nr:hypothetical protein FQA39_LY19134 [Lamprigera yunnana]